MGREKEGKYGGRKRVNMGGNGGRAVGGRKRLSIGGGSDEEGEKGKYRWGSGGEGEGG